MYILQSALHVPRQRTQYRNDRFAGPRAGLEALGKCHFFPINPQEPAIRTKQGQRVQPFVGQAIGPTAIRLPEYQLQQGVVTDQGSCLPCDIQTLGFQPSLVGFAGSLEDHLPHASLLACGYCACQLIQHHQVFLGSGINTEQINHEVDPGA